MKKFKVRFFSEIDGKLMRIDYYDTKEGALIGANLLSIIWPDYEIEEGEF